MLRILLRGVSNTSKTNWYLFSSTAIGQTLLDVLPEWGVSCKLGFTAWWEEVSQFIFCKVKRSTSWEATYYNGIWRGKQHEDKWQRTRNERDFFSVFNALLLPLGCWTFGCWIAGGDWLLHNFRRAWLVIMRVNKAFGFYV